MFCADTGCAADLPTDPLVLKMAQGWLVSGPCGPSPTRSRGPLSKCSGSRRTRRTHPCRRGRRCSAGRSPCSGADPGSLGGYKPLEDSTSSLASAGAGCLSALIQLLEGVQPRGRDLLHDGGAGLDVRVAAVAGKHPALRLRSQRRWPERLIPDADAAQPSARRRRRPHQPRSEHREVQGRVASFHPCRLSLILAGIGGAKWTGASG